VIRVPLSNQPLDAKAIWDLPKVLDDEEDAKVARELFIQAHRAGLRSAAEVAELLDALRPDERKNMLDAIRRKLGLAPQLPPVRGGSGWSPWQLRAVCGCQPLDELTGTPKPVSVRKWHCKVHVDQAGPGDMQPVGSGTRVTDVGVLVEYNAGEIERDLIEAELRERRNQERLAVRKLEAERLEAEKKARDEAFRSELPPELR
jgi:hypothetical protein